MALEIANIHSIMKRIFILLSALALSVGAFAQVLQGDVENDHIYVDYHENAQFPGGEEACFKWMKEHIKYPKDCLEKKIGGRVNVSFIVREDGSIDSIEVYKSPHPSLYKEAIRLVKEMPKWKPAKFDNKCIKSRWRLPITFNPPQ